MEKKQTAGTWRTGHHRNWDCRRRHRDPERPATSETLGLIQVGTTLDYPLDTLRDPITTRFPWIDVSITSTLAEPAEAYDSLRNQYHSTRILIFLEQKIQNLQVNRLLGVTHFDLFVPGLNFVFGEARLPGRVGVISTYRLKASSRGEAGLFVERVVKEAIHEIGHMVGLEHCSDTSCVMYFSNTLADTDYKGPDFCGKCRSQVRMQIE